MRGDAERNAWGMAIADRVEHQDACYLNDGGCSAPFSTVVEHCPKGRTLSLIEQSAYTSWRAVRRGEAAAP